MRFFLGIVIPACLILAAGCSEDTQRLNAPPQGYTERPSSLQDPYVYMVDNAMLEDLSMTDIHFIPHQAELNGTGVRRLERYAKLLRVYGGSIRYTSTRGGEKLSERRLASIRSYLATTGIESGRIDVNQDQPGGLGMSAKEAMAAKSVSVAPGAPSSRAGGGGGPLSALSGLFGGGK